MSSSTSYSVPQATRGPNGYFSAPFSTDPLPGDLRTTLLPVAIMALASFLSTFGLICFITYRMVFWRKYYRIYPGYNQYLLLIFNLVLADFQQSLAFLISFHWIAQNNILAPTAACFIQGWLVQVGDVSSGIWVLAIAIHTWYSVVRGRQVEHFTFACSLVGIWAFVLLLAIIGPASHPKDYFVSTGAWCWVNENYEKFRLGLHYFWILLAQFGSVVIYTSIFCLLRRRMKQVLPASRSSNSGKINRAARFMVIYPIAYVALSLPLPAGRLAVWSGVKVSLTYYCSTATLMTSCGLIDTILYTFTRRVLVKEIGDSSTNLSYATDWAERTAVTVVTGEDGVEMTRSKRSKKKQELNSTGSTEDIWSIVKTATFEVKTETADEHRASASSIEEDR